MKISRNLPGICAFPAVFSGRLSPAISWAVPCVLIGLLLLISGCGGEQGGSGSAVNNEPPSSQNDVEPTDAGIDGFRGLLVDASMVTPTAVAEWADSGYSVALWVSEAGEAEISAARSLTESLGSVDYFFEIARCPPMADAHPEWMASIQGHPEWMRFYPGFNSPSETEVVKVYPWVPVFYREAFDAHVLRIRTALKKLPEPARVWLHDLQGAPSACGCGHSLCRWTADYGPKKTATPLGDEAAALFTTAVATMVPDSEVIPIMAGECEELDKDGPCAGVGCFKGICWKAFAQQMDPLAEAAPVIGASCLFREHDRDLPRYGESGSWPAFSIRSFEDMPPARGGKAVPPQRIIALIQGWDVSPEEIARQQSSVAESGAAGYLLSRVRIDQSWEPKTIRMP